MENIQGNRKDTLIANSWYELDYGLALSAFAEYKVIQQIGLKPILLKRPNNLVEEHGDYKGSITGAFIDCYCEIEEDEYCQQYKNFISGAGRVWSYEKCLKGTNGTFLGDSLINETNKVAWAPTFESTQMEEVIYEDSTKIEKSLKAFDNIVVRNSTDIGICQNVLKITARQMLDPVFLCDEGEYAKIANTSLDNIDGAYMFSYIENGNARIKKYIETGLQIKSLTSKLYVDIGHFVESSVSLGMPISEYLMVEDWLHSIRESAFVVTDSYYGACFAILFNKPLIVISTKDFRANNELEELLSWFGLEERFVRCDEFHDMKDYTYLFRKDIDYAKVNEKLDRLKCETRQWLDSVIIK